MITKTIRGTPVPALGFGTWKLEGDDATEGVRHALELGYRHIDTAQGYGNEARVGEGMRRAGVPREEIFLVTKLAPEHFRRRDALEATRRSLRDLGTDWVDLLLLHWPNPDVPLGETLGALRELQEEGAVRHLGVSNFPSRLVREAREHAEIFANQVEHHPFLGQDVLRAQARELDYLLTAYTPIAKGRVANDATLREIGAAHGKSPVQVTLRWLLQQDRVAAIPKAASAEHREANLDVFDFELSPDEVRRIDGLARGERLVDPAGGPDWD